MTRHTIHSRRKWSYRIRQHHRRLVLLQNHLQSSVKPLNCHSGAYLHAMLSLHSSLAVYWLCILEHSAICGTYFCPPHGQTTVQRNRAHSTSQVGSDYPHPGSESSSASWEALESSSSS